MNFVQIWDYLAALTGFHLVLNTSTETLLYVLLTLNLINFLNRLNRLKIL